MNKRNKNYNHEKGSAILWVLVAVALFAALNFAFNSNSRTSTSLLSDAEAEAYANQIIQYGNEVKSAVKRLQLRGCSDTEISFENDIVSGYENPNSPNDGSCNVFDIAGGGMSYRLADTKMLDESESAVTTYGLYNFAGDTRIPNIGTSIDGLSGNELYIATTALKENICRSINKKLNNFDSEGTPPISGLFANKFIGDYSHAGNFTMSGNVGGKNVFCFEHVGNRFIALHVLIAR